MSTVIDGKALAARMRAEIKERVAAFKAERGREIGLAVVLVGEDSASQVYVRNKIKACEEVGIQSYSYHLPADATQNQVCELVDELAASENVHGILVQLPLPRHIDERELLLNADATVTVCHSKTKNLKEICASADILVVAIGRAKFVTEDMVKEGAVVIDVGMDRDENGRLCGDVDYDAVKEKASYITPVPGGVGPMTITMPWKCCTPIRLFTTICPPWITMIFAEGSRPTIKFSVKGRQFLRVTHCSTRRIPSVLRNAAREKRI